MRGWFPRRCAVEAVDHYDSCQVCPLSPALLSSLILQDISGWEDERQLQGGLSSNSKADSPDRSPQSESFTDVLSLSSNSTSRTNVIALGLKNIYYKINTLRSKVVHTFETATVN